MKITARSALAAVSTILILAACSSSSDDATSSDGGTTLQDGALADGALADGAPHDGAAPDSAPPPCGKSTTLCADGQACASAADCVSNFCQMICTEPGHVDGVKDDGETGIDCGGTAPKKCPPGQGCASNADCDDVACDPTTMLCQPASHTDGITNDGETGIDCGGTADAKCPAGQGCVSNADCDALACTTTAMPPVCAPASHTDGVTNDGETGIDCGGTAPNKCPPGQGCTGDGDCANTRCDTVTLVCDPATSTDGLQNGTETDIDCGGGAPTNAPKCAVGQKCGAANTDANCASSVCNYAALCVEAPSCRNQYGGDTCGPAGSNESCCVSPAVGGVHLDKYAITAGRMRTFVEDAAINGNIQKYITNNKPTWWNDTWTQYLPTVMDNGLNTPDDTGPTYAAWSGFYQDVGPYVHGATAGGNQGCDIRGNGARTYRLPDAVNTRIGDEQDYTQAFLDERALNCTPVYIFAAFCAWDGGQISGHAILNTAWGTAKYPWGNPTGAAPAAGNPAGYDKDYPMDPNGTFGQEAYGEFSAAPYVAAPFNPNPDLLWASHNFNYFGGDNQASSATCSGAPKNPYCDQSIFVAPPGRFPNGNSSTGHADLAGNVFNMTLDFSGATNVYWSRNGSWEGHAIPYGQDTFPSTNKYLATGGRCVRP